MAEKKKSRFHFERKGQEERTLERDATDESFDKEEWTPGKIRRKRASGKKRVERMPVSRRRLKNGSYSIALTGIVAAGAVAINLIASELPSQYTKIDVSEQQLSTLGEETKELAAGLDQDMTLYYIVQDGNEDTNVSQLLERYDDLSSHLTVAQKDPVLYPKFVSQYTDESVTENSVIVTCGDKSRVVLYENMYESEFNYNYYTYETTGFDAEGQITSAIAALNSESLPKLYTLSGHGELTLNDSLAQSIEKENIETETLNLITAEKVPEDADCLLIYSPSSDLSDGETQKILSYLKTGGKVVIITDYSDEEMPNLESVLEYYGVSLVDGVVMEGNSNYYVQAPYYLVPDINSTEVSSDLSGGDSYTLLAAAQGIEMLEDAREGLSIQSVLSSSSSSYSKTDVQNMNTYQKEDQDIEGPFDLGVIITETVELTDELLEEAEAAAENMDTDSLGTLELTSSESGEEEEVSESEEAEDEDSAAGAAGSEEEVSGSEEADEEESADEAAGSEEEVSGSEEAEDEEDSADEAAESEDKTSEEEESDARAAETAETKLAVFTSSALLDASADQMVSGGNSKLFMNTLSWICGHSSTVSVPVKSMSVNYLTLTSAGSSFWSIVVIGIIPGVFLAAGLFIWLRRRKW